ncbi:hypothetical protein [Myroides pelagicus]|uniref:DUF4595 domain-containing protein n=1 Tax=Myroides pelagicus TaxID=270914 RepID=A0A7K1GN00_9FLAO|nr:hypothetical protein [Myroides pelagicus]MTH30272.1 hypothetical protein [Myroides pelagicus]
MKKKKSFLSMSIIALLMASCSSDDTPTPTPVPSNDIYVVESMQSDYYLANDKGEFDKPYDTETKTFTYDDKGALISHTIESIDDIGQPTENIQKYKGTYTYNDKGLLVKYKSVDLIDNTDFWDATLTYNAQELVSEIYDAVEDLKTTFEYNDQRQVLKEVVTTANNVNTIMYQHKEGNIILVDNSPNTSTPEQMKFSYDNTPNPFKYMRVDFSLDDYDFTGEFLGFVHNNKNSVTKYQYNDTEVLPIEYTLDPKTGMPIEQITYFESDKSDKEVIKYTYKKIEQK